MKNSWFFQTLILEASGDDELVTLIQFRHLIMF